MRIDNVTFWIFFGFWPIWLIWELVLIYLKGKGVDADLISQQARQRGHQLNVIPFLWSAMAAHYWLNFAKAYDAAWPAVVFWLLVVATLLLDWHFWNTPYNTLTGFWRVYRWPGTQALLGLVLGLSLFPQRDVFR